MRTWVASMAICVGLAAVALLGLQEGRAISAGRVPAEVARLFEQHGWVASGTLTTGEMEIPVVGSRNSPHSLQSPPWLWYLGLSKSVGLDFSPYAGQPVTTVTFPVRDAAGRRLSQYHLVAEVLTDDNHGVVGAWLCAPETTPGEIAPGEFRCFTLDGNPADRTPPAAAEAPVGPTPVPPERMVCAIEQVVPQGAYSLQRIVPADGAYTLTWIKPPC